MRALRLPPLLLVIVPAALLAQSEPTPPAQGPTTFSVSTKLVQVNVVVHKDGKAVEGLTVEDFQVFDDGRPQRIELFSVESDQAAAATGARPPPSASDFSNRGEGRAIHSVTVILIDRLNTPFEQQALGKQQVLKFLGQIQREDRAALYVLESGVVRVLHDFTSDTEALLRALSSDSAGTSREREGADTRAPRTGMPDFDGWLSRSAASVSQQSVDDMRRATAGALFAITRHLAGVRGRKNLIWISSSFPFNPSELGSRTVVSEVQGATRELNEGNIAVYPVDARGLVGAFATTPPGLVPGRDASRALRSTVSTLETTTGPTEAMQTLADRTGGRAFFNNNDIGTAIRRAADDARLMYVVGYSPGRWDGKFHELKVKVKRSGVEVRHRNGYQASPAQRVSTSAGKRQEAMLEAAQGALEATGIGLRAHIEAVPEAAQQLNVVTRLDPGSVSLQKRGESWEGSVDLIIAQSLAGGTLFKNLDTTVELRLTDALRERLMSEGLVVNRKVPLKPDALRFHIVARDVATGATGSLNIPIEQVRAAAER